MSRARRHVISVSLFPFLAVLICIMGALVIILVLMVARVGDGATLAAAAASVTGGDDPKAARAARRRPVAAGAAGKKPHRENAGVGGQAGRAVAPGRPHSAPASAGQGAARPGTERSTKAGSFAPKTSKRPARSWPACKDEAAGKKDAARRECEDRSSRKPLVRADSL